MSGRPEVPDLISIAGLVKRTGRTRQHIRTLMKEKGAPDPVDVEGLTAAQVFLTAEAVVYLEGRGLSASAPQVGT